MHFSAAAGVELEPERRGLQQRALEGSRRLRSGRQRGQNGAAAAPTPNPQETVPGKLKVKNNNYAKTWKKLKPGKRYVVKVRAENSVGSGKAKQRQFTTNKRTPTLPANG